MTEAEWLACDEPTPMLEFLRGKASDRKLRLLACAILRSAPFSADEQSMWDLVPNFTWFGQAAWRYEAGTNGEAIQTQDVVKLTCHEAVEIAECSADSPGMKPELASAAFATFGARYCAEGDTFGYDPATKTGSAYRERIAGCFEHSTTSSDNLANWMVPRLEGLDQPVSRRFLPAIASLLRDIFGNPFRPFLLDPAWRTPTVVALASQMYGSRDFGAMPILADALQDAGCDSEEVLGHCRGPRPHVRGCWVVDLVLGKS